MISTLKPAFVLLTLLTLLTGVAYPLLITGIAQLVFPGQANGSLIKDANGNALGSMLIGQPFQSLGYFWGRPSATVPYPYNANASSGSNLGPTNPALLDAVKARIEALHAVDPENRAPIPVDLVTASGSGLDPHISPAAAMFQLKRVAKNRRLADSVVRQLIERHIEPRQWQVLGEPRVNVLLLNRALDDLSGNRKLSS